MRKLSLCGVASTYTDATATIRREGLNNNTPTKTTIVSVSSFLPDKSIRDAKIHSYLPKSASFDNSFSSYCLIVFSTEQLCFQRFELCPLLGSLFRCYKWHYWNWND